MIRLQVRGRPFLILGEELGNSSAGTAAQADTILPKLALIHVNTVLGEETLRSDAHAFSELMRHIREKDGQDQTVLMVQGRERVVA